MFNQIVGRRVGALSVLAILAMLGFLVLSGFGHSKARPVAVSAPPEITVAQVLHRPLREWQEFSGRLQAVNTVEVRPRVSGYVDRVAFEDGARVKKGQLLFQIDPRPFQALLDQANAQLAQTQAQLAKTQMDVDRDTPLAKAHAIAQSQLDNDIQENRAAAATVKAAEAQVKQAHLNLDFTNVRSLIDGVVGIAQVQMGNLVNPTTVLTSVSQINPIKAYFSISEQEYLHYAERINAEAQKERPSNGPPFDLILADGSVYPLKGFGLLTNRQVDVSTGSIQVVCSFPNPQSYLRPGQFGRLRAAADIRHGALLVPQKAVSELQGSYQVAVVSLDNKVSIRDVKVENRVGSMWIVKSGVKPGELVIIEGLQRVQSGATVKIKQLQAKGD